MSDGQAWAVVMAVVGSGMDGGGWQAGAWLLAFLFLAADAREQRNAGVRS